MRRDIALRFECERARRDGESRERAENAQNIERFVDAVFFVVVAVALPLRTRDSREVLGKEGVGVFVVLVEDGRVRRVRSIDAAERERERESLKVSAICSMTNTV